MKGSREDLVSRARDAHNRLSREDVVAQCGCENIDGEVEFLLCRECNEPASYILMTTNGTLGLCQKCATGGDPVEATFTYRPPIISEELAKRSDQVIDQLGIDAPIHDTWVVNLRSTQDDIDIEREFDEDIKNS